CDARAGTWPWAAAGIRSGCRRCARSACPRRRARSAGGPAGLAERRERPALEQVRGAAQEQYWGYGRPWCETASLTRQLTSDLVGAIWSRNVTERECFQGILRASRGCRVLLAALQSRAA